MSDDKPKWDQPSNVTSPAPDLAAGLALEHGITPQRAQMLIDRLGTDPGTLKAAAEELLTSRKA